MHPDVQKQVHTGLTKAQKKCVGLLQKNLYKYYGKILKII